MPSSPIGHVSDTARLVAMYRAWETERPDPLFRDPLARRLAGPQGETIVNALPGGEVGAWTIVMRTVVLDEIILRAVKEEGVDVVLNLAAGLDTRPYRLDLPESLKWVEVDFPETIELKDRELASEMPCCQVERIAADLSDVAARRAVLRRVGALGKKIFVLTEGLVMYLPPEQIAALASDLADVPTIAEWAMDLLGPFMKAVINTVWFRQLRAGNSTFKFAPAQGVSFFEPYGWKLHELRSFEEEAQHFRRTPFYFRPWYFTRPLVPRRVREMIDQQTAVMVVLERHHRA